MRAFVVLGLVFFLYQALGKRLGNDRFCLEWDIVWGRVYVTVRMEATPCGQLPPHTA